MDSAGLSIALLLMVAAFILLWRGLLRIHRTHTARINQPLLPATPVLRQLIYCWWLLVGFWPARRLNLQMAAHPVKYRLAIYAYRWLLFLTVVMFIMLLLALMDQWG